MNAGFLFSKFQCSGAGVISSVILVVVGMRGGSNVLTCCRRKPTATVPTFISLKGLCNQLKEEEEEEEASSMT